MCCFSLSNLQPHFRHLGLTASRAHLPFVVADFQPRVPSWPPARFPSPSCGRSSPPRPASAERSPNCPGCPETAWGRSVTAGCDSWSGRPGRCNGAAGHLWYRNNVWFNADYDVLRCKTVFDAKTRWYKIFSWTSYLENKLSSKTLWYRNEEFIIMMKMIFGKATFGCWYSLILNQALLILNQAFSISKTWFVFLYPQYMTWCAEEFYKWPP